MATYSLLKEQKRSAHAVRGLFLALNLFLKDELDPAVFEAPRQKKFQELLALEGPQNIWNIFLAKLGTRAKNVLGEIYWKKSLQEFLKRTCDHPLGEIRGLGSTSVDEIESALAEWGLRSQMPLEEIEEVFSSDT